jgi:hypothetical protein
LYFEGSFSKKKKKKKRGGIPRQLLKKISTTEMSTADHPFCAASVLGAGGSEVPGTVLGSSEVIDRVRLPAW